MLSVTSLTGWESAALSLASGPLVTAVIASTVYALRGWLRNRFNQFIQETLASMAHEDEQTHISNGFGQTDCTVLTALRHEQVQRDDQACISSKEDHA